MAMNTPPRITMDANTCNGRYRWRSIKKQHTIAYHHYQCYHSDDIVNGMKKLIPWEWLQQLDRAAPMIRQTIHATPLTNAGRVAHHQWVTSIAPGTYGLENNNNMPLIVLSTPIIANLYCGIWRIFGVIWSVHLSTNAKAMKKIILNGITVNQNKKYGYWRNLWPMKPWHIHYSWDAVRQRSVQPVLCVTWLFEIHVLNNHTNHSAGTPK